MKEKLIDHLKELVTPERMDKMIEVLNLRTRYLTVVVEDISKLHNASAVVRNCDCFGIQDLHVIENRNLYEINQDIAMGSSNWITQHTHSGEKNNTLSTIQDLKAKGYRIVATTPHTNDVNLQDFDLMKGKAAFFFGTERDGLSEEVMENADEYLKIPMLGFTESFNISVSVSIILHQLVNKMHQLDIDWALSEEEKQVILLEWLKVSVKKSDLVIDRFLKENKLSMLVKD